MRAFDKPILLAATLTLCASTFVLAGPSMSRFNVSVENIHQTRPLASHPSVGAESIRPSQSLAPESNFSMKNRSVISNATERYVQEGTATQFTQRLHSLNDFLTKNEVPISDEAANHYASAVKKNQNGELTNSESHFNAAKLWASHGARGKTDIITASVGTAANAGAAVLERIQKQVQQTASGKTDPFSSPFHN